MLGVVDDGALGNAAVHLADRLADALALPLLATTVVPPRTPSPPRQLERAAISRGRAVLERSAAELARPPRTVLLVGEPAHSIVALAQRHRASMVVVSAPDNINDARLGHAYLAVLRAVACPVVVIPPGVGSLAWTDGPVTAVGVGSSASIAAAAVATDLASALDTTLSNVRVAQQAYGTSAAAALRRSAAAERAQLIVVELDRFRPDDVVSPLVRDCTCPVVVVPRPAQEASATTRRAYRSPESPLTHNGRSAAAA